MIKKIVPVLLFLMCLMFLQRTYGQSQINSIDFLRQKFLIYCESVPREEIFLHSDREEYIAGEDMWFNIYLIDRQSSNTSLNSRIVYFEILNSGNSPIVQKRFRVENGFGPGQIVLPDSLSTGTYTIRAYTNWMKNFLPVNCFMKEIKVYNAFITKSLKGRTGTINFQKEETKDKIDNLQMIPGLTLKANNLRSDTLEIFVNADQKYRSENNNLFYLFIQTHGKINLVSSEIITETNTKITIPKLVLSPGINQITLFDSKVQPICEKFIYTPEVRKEQFFTFHSIDSCSTRNRVTLECKIGDKLSSKLNEANFSISVTPLTNKKGPVELEDYMVFGTEFGFEPWLALRGRKIDKIPPEEMDSLLLTLKSNWINWKDILSVELPVFNYQIEKDNHYLSGTLLTADQQLAHPGEFLLMSTPGKVPVFQFTRTDYKADFNFYIPIDEDLKDLIIQPDDTTKNNKIIIESSFSNQYLKSEFKFDSISNPIPPYISKWSVNYQVRKIYESSSVGDLLIPFISPIKSRRFYGKPDVEVFMKNYIKLPVMEEVFFELIPHVTLKNNKSGYEISIVDPFGNKVYDDPPVLMIDGVIIKDPTIIANLDPELVEKIDVIRERYLVGDFSFYGIVNVITKAGDFSYVSLPNYAIRLKYRVVDPIRSFGSPDYSSAEMKASRTPDFRNTLYWNPSVKPEKDGKAIIEFWTSDIKSDYEINIQGITPEGKFISLKRTIKVK